MILVGAVVVPKGPDLGECAANEHEAYVQAATGRARATVLAPGNASVQSGVKPHCHDCGERISEVRLDALPNAIRCKGCEEKHERLFPKIPGGQKIGFRFTGL